jgi:hypothetical protein
MGSPPQATILELEFLKYRVHGETLVSLHFTEDRAKRAGFERVMRGNSQVMLTADLCGEPARRTDLPGELAAKRAAQGFFQIGGGQIAWQFHVRVSTSSNTR